MSAWIMIWLKCYKQGKETVYKIPISGDQEELLPSIEQKKCDRNFSTSD
jgi:hypothetical protein